MTLGNVKFRLHLVAGVEPKYITALIFTTTVKLLLKRVRIIPLLIFRNEFESIFLAYVNFMMFAPI